MTNETKTPRDGAASSGLMKYELDAKALREKTERLKALRLARAATEPPAAAKAPKPKAPAAKPGTGSAITGKVSRATATRGSKRSAAKPSRSLSEWLSDQEALGRKP
jgi:hypothetical protein